MIDYCYTSSPLPLYPSLVQAGAKVRAVYATTINPWSHKPQRVRVESVRLINILGQGGRPPYKVAAVIGIEPHTTLGYDVEIQDLHNLSAFVVLEINHGND